LDVVTGWGGGGIRGYNNGSQAPRRGVRWDRRLGVVAHEKIFLKEEGTREWVKHGSNDAHAYTT